MDEYWNSGERRGRQGSEEEYTLKLPHFERREERYRTYRAKRYEEEPYIPLSQRNAGQRRSSRQDSRRDSRAESSRHTYRPPAGRGSGGNRRRRRGRSGMPGWAKVLCAVGAALLLLAVAGLMYYNYLLGLVDMKKEDDYAVEETTDSLQEPDPLADFDPSSVVWDQNTVYRQEDGVLNFLLIGEENMDDNARGRADAIMIATINQKEKAIRLTSIMRDSYVQIPDYQGKTYRDNKINVSYTFGGMTLAMKTIEENFNIQLDGYAKVDYSRFEQLIDALGGVEITLGEEEADYLNRTNYISKKKYRNVKAGTQTLNGNQALGYSRIRKVKTPEGVGDDWGRTLRQRNVLNAVFEKYKSKSLVELVMMLPKMMELVSTDLDKNQITSLLATVVSCKPDKLETKSIPVNGGFERQIIPNGIGDSLVLDMNQNIEELHRFIFGTTIEEQEILDAGGTLDTTAQNE